MTWMGVKEYAEHLGTSTHAVQAMCKKGTITAVKIGVAWRIAVERADEDLISMKCKQFKRENDMPNLNDAKEKYLKEVV